MNIDGRTSQLQVNYVIIPSTAQARVLEAFKWVTTLLRRLLELEVIRRVCERGLVVLSALRVVEWLWRTIVTNRWRSHPEIFKTPSWEEKTSSPSRGIDCCGGGVASREIGRDPLFFGQSVHCTYFRTVNK
ncbi:hypothetical protein AVEN_265275-1 [Araneus ventricosus]|uniref:Uncharacterized protein n=1 Tax=Araneus ventricosus TaxID=182803 RepID=A0A4Y2JX60_ARAVE|nr:hypothetical protein AVEN_265275-1 [Araneus ventricosus]